MELEFSPEQEAIREGVRRVLGRECDTRVVRAAMVDGSTTSQSLFATVSELGWLMTAIPEPYGGLESGYDTLCGIVEELGRSLAPIPFLPSIIAMEAVAFFGSEAQRKSYFALLGSGERIGCFAWSESGGRVCESAIDATVRDGRLSGVKSPVVDGGGAHLAVTVARGEGGEIGLFVVDLEAAGVTRSALTSLDPTRPLAKLVFDGAACDRLKGANGWADVQYILDRAAILVAFEQLGGADRCLELARDYALERSAFGRKIGSFQAIKHKLAEVYVSIELARSNAHYAAWALQENNAKLAEAAAIARISAGEAFDKASREAILVFGGIGITWDQDCHLFYRRARHLALALGAPDQWRDRLARLLRDSRFGRPPTARN